MDSHLVHMANDIASFHQSFSEDAVSYTHLTLPTN